MRHAVVVGAGIGGLGAALGLRRAGWQVTVLEQAERFEPVGAGVTLMPNALRALDELGVGPAFRALSPVRVSGGVRTNSGRWLARWDAGLVQEVLGAPMVNLHRADLHRLLRSPLPPESVRTGVAVVRVTELGPGRLRVESGGGAVVAEADLVVAADGIHSTLRAQGWPEAPRPAYSGITTWRGVGPAPPGRSMYVGQSWGPGAEFGVVPLTDGRIYWFGAVAGPNGIFHADERAAARRRFDGWHPPIPELIDTCDTVVHHDIEHLPQLPAPFARGRVVLLGDAAHAMTPHLGQGGCQALEDAVVLAAALSQDPDVDAALRRYDRQRRPRVEGIRRSAAGVARVNALRNPIAVAVRNGVVRLTPSALGVRSMARISGWHPPRIAGPGADDRARATSAQPN